MRKYYPTDLSDEERLRIEPMVRLTQNTNVVVSCANIFEFEVFEELYIYNHKINTLEINDMLYIIWLILV
ncbi:MAG: hypothetical protein SFT93_03350 [Rickettsiaceae bacterium]|nr:hypothetical protein [Rickettsiaceae bacterium]